MARFETDGDFFEFIAFWLIVSALAAFLGAAFYIDFIRPFAAWLAR